MSPSQSDHSSRVSDRDMETQLLFTPERSSPLSSRTKPNQSDDWNRGCKREMINQISFTPERSSNANSRIK